MVPMVMVLEGRSTAQNDLAAGRDVLRYFEPAGVTPGPMDVFIHKPTAWRPQDGRLLVVLHGADRNATLLRDTWRPIAERYNLLLIVPEFSEAKFPGTLWYNLGNVTDAARRPQPKAAWTFHALDRAVDAVRQATGAVNDRFQLYGFSAGAQFAHRYLLLTGAPRVDLVVADSGGGTPCLIRRRTIPAASAARPRRRRRSALPWATRSSSMSGSTIRNRRITSGPTDTRPAPAAKV
ncbi:hypothetical protein AL346_22145 (plasmid) [Chelatococcus sp. CO-6]|nr:hypothetical protein AL346_22145 [Chelatococcus sp. CO-6]